MEDTRTYPDGHEHSELIVYASPAMKIGKHEWRIVVYRNKYYGLCTAWEFRGPNAPVHRPAWKWNSAKYLWPGYDGNKFDSGIPITTAKLFDRHKADIERALQCPAIA